MTIQELKNRRNFLRKQIDKAKNTLKNYQLAHGHYEVEDPDKHKDNPSIWTYWVPNNWRAEAASIDLENELNSLYREESLLTAKINEAEKEAEANAAGFKCVKDFDKYKELIIAIEACKDEIAYHTAELSELQEEFNAFMKTYEGL